MLSMIKIRSSVGRESMPAILKQKIYKVSIAVVERLPAKKKSMFPCKAENCYNSKKRYPYPRFQFRVLNRSEMRLARVNNSAGKTG